MSTPYDIGQAQAAAGAANQAYFNPAIPPARLWPATCEPSGVRPPSWRAMPVVLPAPRCQDEGATVYSLRSVPHYNLLGVTSSGGLGHAPLTIGRAPDGFMAFQFNRPSGYQGPFSNQAFQRAFATPGIRHIGASFRFFLQEGYNHGLDGKHIGGLWGGAYNWSGGTPPERQTGTTLRNTWLTEPDSRIRTQLYAYCLNRCQTRVGGLMFGGKSWPADWGVWPAGSWPIGQWSTLEYEAKMNTPGLADGYARMWIAGAQVAEIQDCIWAINDEWLWRGVMVNEYWGRGTVARPQKAWVKDIAAYDLGS